MEKEEKNNMINKIRISKNFLLCEFQCPCCNQVMLHPELLEKLQALRDEIQTPICISSGYRCPKHNEEIGGAKNSYHMKGMAADIKTVLPLQELFTNAIKVGFRGIGIYKQKNFLHVDVRRKKTIWHK